MIHDLIEVFLRRVKPRPTRFMEYSLPESESKSKSQTALCYVEAKTDERFQIHIRLHHGFRYYTSTCLEMRLWLDAHQEPDVYIRKKVHIPGDGRRYFEYVIDDFAVQVGDRWENGLLCFGEVQIDDEKDKAFRKSELKDRSMKLGTVRVSVQRGRVDPAPVPEEEPESVKLDGHVSPSNVRNGITHYVKTVNNRVIEPPKSDNSNHFRPIAGPHGERFIFEFHYRCRAELQRLEMMDDDGNRIDPAPIEHGHELPVVPWQRAGPSGGTEYPTASHSSSSPLFVPQTVPQTVPQPTSLPRGLLSSPLSGYSAAHTKISSVSRSRPMQGLSGMSSRTAISAGAGLSYAPSFHTTQGGYASGQKGNNKKRLLPENTSSSPAAASPAPKKRVVLPPIDLTLSTSPPPAQQPPLGPPSSIKLPPSSPSPRFRPDPATRVASAAPRRSSISGPVLPSSSSSSASQPAATLRSKHRPYPFSFAYLTNTAPRPTAAPEATQTAAPATDTSTNDTFAPHQQHSSPPPSSPAGLTPPQPMLTSDDSASAPDQTIAPPSSPSPYPPAGPIPNAEDDAEDAANQNANDGFVFGADEERMAIDVDMSEEELRLEIRRVELQQRQLEMRIRLERMRRLQERRREWEREHLGGSGGRSAYGGDDEEV